MIIKKPDIDGRLIFIGDVHGCYDELVNLLNIINPKPEDYVISIGDFVDRGPYSNKCIDLWLNNQYMATLGNHDYRILKWSKGYKVPNGEGLDETISLIGKSDKYINFLQKLPRFIYFLDLNIFAVHAAVDVNKKIKTQINQSINNDIFLRGRFIRFISNYQYIKTGQECGSDKYWWEEWRGPEIIIFGHTPQINGKPLHTNYAIGIDTGCVYGDKLTAAIFSPDLTWKFISVKSKTKYWQKAVKKDIIYF